jgi:hypothetical protein
VGNTDQRDGTPLITNVLGWTWLGFWVYIISAVHVAAGSEGVSFKTETWLEEDRVRELIFLEPNLEHLVHHQNQALLVLVDHQLYTFHDG